LPIGSFADGLPKGDAVNVLDDLVHGGRRQVPSSGAATTALYPCITTTRMV
jgi:hypothetical protein